MELYCIHIVTTEADRSLRTPVIAAKTAYTIIQPHRTTILHTDIVHRTDGGTGSAADTVLTGYLPHPFHPVTYHITQHLEDRGYQSEVFLFQHRPVCALRFDYPTFLRLQVLRYHSGFLPSFTPEIFHSRFSDAPRTDTALWHSHCKAGRQDPAAGSYELFNSIECAPRTDTVGAHGK